VAAVVLSPPAAEDVARGVLCCLGEEPLEAVEVTRRHFLRCFRVRPETGEVEAFQNVLSLLLHCCRCSVVGALNCDLFLLLWLWVVELSRRLLVEELVEVGEVQARGIGGGEWFDELRRRGGSWEWGGGRGVEGRGTAAETGASCLEHVKVVCGYRGADLHHG